MEIDTLILSGASSKGIGYVGVLYALLKKDLIDMKKIKNIIACSSGAIFGFMLVLNFSINAMYKLLQNIDLINLNDFDSDELFIDNGIFNNNSVYSFFKTCLKIKYNLNNINFKDLYEKTKILFIVKVYNLSIQKEEYFSYKNKPNMSVLDAIQMSTCIPIIFKPIKYDDNYYVDGGTVNNIPHLKNKKYKNYLLIYITSINNDLKTPVNYDNIDFIDYISKIFNIVTSSKKSKNKRNIRIVIDLEPTNFYVKSVLDDIILDSYEQTLKHIKDFNL